MIELKPLFLRIYTNGHFETAGFKGFPQGKGTIPCRLRLGKRPYPADFELDEGGSSLKPL
eukprot:5770421-Amphidinium_carterae.1